MNILGRFFAILLLVILAQGLYAQADYQEKITVLKKQKEQVSLQEKEALKTEVEQINDRVTRGILSEEEARLQKESAARKRALNIENRIAIIDHKIALLERNKGEVLKDEKEVSVFEDGVGISINVGDEPWDVFGHRNKVPKYDRRTYSDFVFAIGFNNAVIKGQSFNDSPYKVGGSRFFEYGWAWRTRVFKKSNFMRFHYGFSFQNNGLKPEDNNYFVDSGVQTELEEFPENLDKSKFRMDNLVIPLHFEFGPSVVKQTENRIRYSLEKQFRIGIGGYGGINLSTRQKLKYKLDGDEVKDKLKRGYNTNNFIYGLSAYLGVEGVLLYAKYDLNTIFKDPNLEQRNISFGLRFDM